MRAPVYTEQGEYDNQTETYQEKVTDLLISLKHESGQKGFGNDIPFYCKCGARVK